MQKPQIRITFEFVPSVNSAPPVEAQVHRLVDESWERVVIGQVISATEDGARLAAVAALDKLFGVNGYDLE